ncbi:MAG: hypothetical protein R3F55_16565 [Alphaproteobacteria bacterium]
MRVSSRLLLAAAIIAAAAPALAQNDADPAAQAAGDQQVDLALGTLDAPPPLRLSMALEPPALGVGFRGRQPFDQQPPAAQSDFSDPTVTVNPRGSKP